MRISTVLLTLLMPSLNASELQFIDSKIYPDMSYVLVDACIVPIPKNKVRNYCYVEKKVNDFCKLDIRLDKCDE